MALTATLLTSGTDTVDATSKTTASITTDAARLTLAWIFTSKGTTPELPTITDANRTWVQVATVLFNTIASPTRRLTVFRCMGAATGTLTFDFGGVTQTSFMYAVSEWAGVDTGGTNGSAAILQAVTGASDSTNAPSITLAAFGSANNGVSAGMAKTGASAITPGTGFTELVELNAATPSSLFETQWRADNDTSVEWSWTTASTFGGIAIEVAASTVGPQTILASSALHSWAVPTALVLAGALSLAAPAPATATWTVPTAVVAPSVVTFTPSPASTTWTLPAATVTPSALTVVAGSASTTWTVADATVAPSAVTLVADAASTAWTLPTAAAIPGLVTLTPAPVTTAWSVPSGTVVPGAVTLPASVATTTWTVPDSTLLLPFGIAATPAITTWVVPASSLVSVAAGISSLEIHGSYETSVGMRGSWNGTVSITGRVG